MPRKIPSWQRNLPTLELTIPLEDQGLVRDLFQYQHLHNDNTASWPLRWLPSGFVDLVAPELSALHGVLTGSYGIGRRLGELMTRLLHLSILVRIFRLSQGGRGFEKARNGIDGGRVEEGEGSDTVSDDDGFAIGNHIFSMLSPQYLPRPLLSDTVSDNNGCATGNNIFNMLFRRSLPRPLPQPRRHILLEPPLSNPGTHGPPYCPDFNRVSERSGMDLHPSRKRVRFEPDPELVSLTECEWCNPVLEPAAESLGAAVDEGAQPVDDDDDDDYGDDESSISSVCGPELATTTTTITKKLRIFCRSTSISRLCKECLFHRLPILRHTGIPEAPNSHFRFTRLPNPPASSPPLATCPSTSSSFPPSPFSSSFATSLAGLREQCNICHGAADFRCDGCPLRVCMCCEMALSRFFGGILEHWLISLWGRGAKRESKWLIWRGDGMDENDERVEARDERAEKRDERAEKRDERAEKRDERAEKSDERAEKSDERAEKSDERAEEVGVTVNSARIVEGAETDAEINGRVGGEEVQGTGRVGEAGEGERDGEGRDGGG